MSCAGAGGCAPLPQAGHFSGALAHGELIVNAYDNVLVQFSQLLQHFPSSCFHNVLLQTILVRWTVPSMLAIVGAGSTAFLAHSSDS